MSPLDPVIGPPAQTLRRISGPGRLTDRRLTESGGPEAARFRVAFEPVPRRLDGQTPA
jgi:hypothetical protein